MKAFLVNSEAAPMSVLFTIWLTSTLLILVTNLTLLGVIMASRTLRQSPRHLLVVSMCCANILVGSFVGPLVLTSLSANWRHSRDPKDCGLLNALEAYTDYGASFIIGWSLLKLDCSVLCDSMDNRTPHHNTFRRYSAIRSTLHVFFPWLLACLLLLVLYFLEDALAEQTYTGEECYLYLMNTTSRHGLSILCIILPLVFCTATTLGIIAVVLKKRWREPGVTSGARNVTSHSAVVNDHDQSNEDASASQSLTAESCEHQPAVDTECPSHGIPDPQPSLYDALWLCIPNAVFIVLSFEQFVLMTCELFGTCHFGTITRIVFLVCYLARFYLLPISWLANNQIRSETREWYLWIGALCSGNQRHRDSSIYSVPFSVLEDTQTV